MADEPTQTIPVETPQAQAPAESATPPPKPEPTVSLEEIYQKYNPQPAAPQAPPQPQYNQPYYPAPEQTATADPIEPTAAELKAQLDQLKRDLGQEREMNAKERDRIALETQQRDIDDAIERLSQDIDVPNKKYVKYALADFWENNPTFQKIWEQRRQHPKMFADALRAAKPVIEGALSIKSDPDLVQKQMAMDQATKSIGSEPVTPKTEGERFAQMNDAEFQYNWAKIAGRTQ